MAYISAKPENVKRVKSWLKGMIFLADLLHTNSGGARKDNRRIAKTSVKSIQRVDRLWREYPGCGPEFKVKSLYP